MDLRDRAQRTQYLTRCVSDLQEAKSPVDGTPKEIRAKLKAATSELEASNRALIDQLKQLEDETKLALTSGKHSLYDYWNALKGALSTVDEFKARSAFVFALKTADDDAVKRLLHGSANTPTGLSVTSFAADVEKQRNYVVVEHQYLIRVLDYGDRNVAEHYGDSAVIDKLSVGKKQLHRVQAQLQRALLDFDPREVLNRGVSVVNRGEIAATAGSMSEVADRTNKKPVW
jgi:hypothetical protein